MLTTAELPLTFLALITAVAAVWAARSRGLIATRHERDAASARAQRVVGLGKDLQDLSEGEYLARSVLDGWLARNLTSDVPELSDWETRVLPEELRRAYRSTSELLSNPKGWAEGYNSRFTSRRLTEIEGWAESLFKHPLTGQQRQAIVVNDDVNLVVAGAGTGKTATILARVAYLVQWDLARPDEILVLAFNSSVAAEVRGRLEEMGISGVEVSTFHAKGYDVLGSYDGRKPAVSSLATDDNERLQLFQKTLASLVESPEFFEQLSRWWVESLVEEKDLEDCETPDERFRREDSLGRETLTGKRLRSQGEIKVADWLSLHGIRWEYERVYPHSPPSAERRDYTPDFFLPEDGIWIELWAARRDGELPQELDGRPFDRDRYKKGMKWKRDLHQEHRTVLVEVFQDEVWSGQLGEILGKGLEEKGVELRSLTADERLALFDPEVKRVKRFVLLIDSFLNLFRGGCWSREEIKARARERREHDFLELFWPFLDAYEDALQADDEKIDFHEMLRGARDRMERRPRPTPYRQILVDEFQDTSRARLEFLLGLRGEQDPARLFLVGDDWQSIYRFAGSDIHLFTDLQTRFMFVARTDLDRTFRLTSDVTHVSTTFVTRNPRQLAKSIAPRDHSGSQADVCVCIHGFGKDVEALQWALRDIADRESSPADVLVLARYNFQLKDPELRDAISQVAGRLRFRGYTVHRAKGLEADHVIVVGLETGILGFPCEITDDRVLRLVLSAEEGYSQAEERRLFYVALTRTRGRVYLLSPNHAPSAFIQELREDVYAEAVEILGKESERHRCPKCRGKTIQRRMHHGSPFWACTNFPRCDGVLAGCSRCEEGALEPILKDQRVASFGCTACAFSTEACPNCGHGALLEKTGRRGPFLGCSNWRRDGSGCRYTRNVKRRDLGVGVIPPPVPTKS